MSLVGYEYSDDEEGDQEVFDSKSVEPVKDVPVASSSPSLITTKNGSSNLPLNATNKPTDTSAKLSQLPSASLVTSTLKKDSIKRSASGRIQITADLSLLNAQQSDDSDDEEERERKRLKKSMHGSRLITMLPKPKNPTKTTTSKSSLTSLVPNSVANRSKAPNTSTKTPNTSTKTQIETNEKKPASSASSFFFTNSDDDDDEEEYKLPQIEKEILPTPFVSSAAPILDARPVYGPSKPESIADAILTDSLYSPLDQSVPKLDPNKDITYKKFIASKFGDEASAGDIKFVDFDMSKHLSQNTDWLKNITIEKEDRDEEDAEGNAPNSTARRKNQITFLAYQAKKRETELKNQWAANRQSKNQTRKKYGF